MPQNRSIERLLKPRTALPACPACNSNASVISVGIRRGRSKDIRKFLCKSCNKNFSDEPLKRITAPTRVVLAAISEFHSGHTLAEAANIVRRRYKVNVAPSTIVSWIDRYCDLFTFTGLRRRYKIDPETNVRTARLDHGQVYTFKVHLLKMNIAGKIYPQLKGYLRSVPDAINPKYFATENRCSSFRPETVTEPQSKFIADNNAVKMAKLAETLSKTRKGRHDVVETFFLTNDSTTVAVEVPVYLTETEAKDLNLGPALSHSSVQSGRCVLDCATENKKEACAISGHIDILQVRNEKVYILDYKPDEHLNQAITSQLLLYAYALRQRTNIPLANMVCACFGRSGYAEFRPQLR